MNKSYLIVRNIFIALKDVKKSYSYNRIFKKFSAFTMIPELLYEDNLELCDKNRHISGDVVECGVWRGGMIAGIADLLKDERNYFLFDSFEGLPDVTAIDGASAKEWQNAKDAPSYFDNCKAEIQFAEKAMKTAGCKKYTLIKGWFNETLPVFPSTNQIAILRLDGDWYESTMCCLENLYAKVVPGGIVIIDDYYTWDGCTLAVHDYFSKHKIPVRIEQTKNGVCYIRKPV